MKTITWQRWAVTFTILILLGLLADYFFLHLLFDPSQRLHFKSNVIESPHSEAALDSAPMDAAVTEDSVKDTAVSAAEKADQTDNFLATLQVCRPGISAQGIATPEALISYLSGSIGKKAEVVETENFILALPDGSERRVHLIPKENSNSKDARELRYFSVDAEGYPEPLELSEKQKQMPVDELAKTLVAEGQLKEHQKRSAITLKDESFLSLEIHNNQIFEFQWRHSPEEPTFSCRRMNCLCR